MATKPIVVKLADTFYMLLKHTTAGAKSIVWQAVQLTAPLTGEVHLLPEQDTLEYLRNPSESYIPQEDPQIAGQKVALKVARLGQEGDLDHEASILRGFTAELWHQSGTAQIVRILPPTQLPTQNLPIIVLEWVDGVQLDKLPDKLPEPKALHILEQLSGLITKMWSIKRTTLAADNVKPNSIFWNTNTDRLTLIDWNIQATSEKSFLDMIPSLGNTLYALLTGSKQPNYWIGGTFSVDPEKVGGVESWPALTYGTMALIRKLLLADFKERDPGQLPKQLSDAIKTQIDLWEKDPESLLDQARTAQGEKALSLYTIAKKSMELKADDTERMIEAMKTVLVDFTRQHAHSAALMTLSWARAHYPQNRELRWAWMGHTAAQHNPLDPLADVAMQALQALYQHNTSIAAAMLKESSDPHLSALRSEAAYWAALELFTRQSTSQHLEELNGAREEFFKQLKGLLPSPEYTQTTENVNAEWEKTEKAKREQAATAVKEAKMFLSFYAEEPSKNYLTVPEVTTWIDEQIRLTNACIHGALTIDAEDGEALKAQQALEAFRKGRTALRNRDVNTAVVQLQQVESYTDDWEGLKGLNTPYLALAQTEQRIGRPYQGTEIKEGLNRLKDYGEAERHLGKIALPPGRFDEWLTERKKDLSEQIDKGRQKVQDDVKAAINLWQDHWTMWTASGELLTYLPRYQELKKTLEIEFKDGELDRWLSGQRATVLSKCDDDLVQAFLIRAQSYLEQGDSQQAQTALRQVKNIAIGKERNDRSRIRLTQILKKLWLQALDAASPKTHLWQTAELIEQIEELSPLMQALEFNEPEPEDQKANNAITKETMAERLAQYPPDTVKAKIAKLSDYYSYNAVAEFIREKRYQEAWTRLQETDNLRFDQDSVCIITTLEEEIRKIWFNHLNAGDWAQGISTGYQSLSADKEFSDLLERFLNPSPPSDLHGACDGFITTDSEMQKKNLAAQLAKYTPSSYLSILHHFDRAFAMIAMGQYKAAHDWMQTYPAENMSTIERAASKQLRQKCTDILSGELQKIWLKHLNADDWAQGINTGYQSLSADKALSDLLERFLNPSPPSNLHGACDGFITTTTDSEMQKKNLAAQLAKYTPSSYRSILYHFDRAFAMIARGQYKAAHDWIQAYPTENMSAVERVAIKQLRQKCTEILKKKLAWKTPGDNPGIPSRAAALADSVNELDEDLLQLIQDGSSPYIGSVNGLADQVIAALIEWWKAPQQQDADRLAMALSTAVMASQTKPVLCDALRYAFLRRYKQEVERLCQRKHWGAAWHYWMRKASQELKALEDAACIFNEKMPKSAPETDSLQEDTQGDTNG